MEKNYVTPYDMEGKLPLKQAITTSTKKPTNRFSREPKSPLLAPPPKEPTPTEIKDSPIDNYSDEVMGARLAAGKGRKLVCDS